MNEENKVQVLLAAVAERNKAIHIMRERVQKVCIWLMGVFLVFAGWIVQQDVDLSDVQKGMLVLLIVIATSSIRWGFLKNIHQGFNTQLQVLAKVEEALKLYEPGFFDSSPESLYPASWRNAGGKNGSGRYFTYSYMLLYIGALTLLIVVIGRGWFF